MTGNPPPAGPRSPIAMARSYFPPEDIAEFQAAAAGILTGRVSMGMWVERFQQIAAETHGARFAYAANSCTAALEVSLLACGVGPGDEVITVSHSYIATANSVRYCGATPVFVDIDPVHYNIDPDLVEAAITPLTRAILCVHQIGMPCDLAGVLAAVARV